VDILHLTNSILFAGSVVKRSHGEKHDRILDGVRFATSGGFELTTPHRDEVNCPRRRGHRLQALSCTSG